MVSTEYLLASTKVVQLHRMASLGVEIVVNEHVKSAGADVNAGSGPAEAAPTTSANATNATAAAILLRISSTPLVVNVARYERRSELGDSQVLRGEQPPFRALRHRGAFGVPVKLAVLSFGKLCHRGGLHSEPARPTHTQRNNSAFPCHFVPSCRRTQL